MNTIVEDPSRGGSVLGSSTPFGHRFNTSPGELNVSFSGNGTCLVGGSTFGSNGYAQLLEYTYEVETVGPFNDSILGWLKRAVANALLPLLFENCTDSRRRYLRIHRSLATIGLSVDPVDTVLGGGESKATMSKRLVLAP